MRFDLPFRIPSQSQYDYSGQSYPRGPRNDYQDQESQDIDTEELSQSLRNSADYYSSNSGTSQTVQEISNQIKAFGLAVQKWEFGNSVRGESHINWLQCYKNINDAPGLKLSQSA
jgi:hypothetical protein